MPVPTPDFGIDPALLTAGSPPPPSPLDTIGAALEALAASGAQVGPLQPSLYGTGAHDTDLMDPSVPQDPVHLKPGVPSAQYDASGNQIHGRVLPPGSVTVTGQQRMPTDREAAIRTRQDQLNDPSAPIASGDIEGYDVREQQAMQAAHAARQRQAAAEIMAEQQQAERLAKVHEESAYDQATADSLYQQQRQAIHAEADAETVTWLQQYQAKAQQEPNPDRWFESRTGLGKALWALGMVFGAVHAGITPGAQNVALNLALSEIHRDVDLQKQRLERELEGLKMKGTLMEKRQARNLTDAADDHSMFMGRLQSLKQAYLARAMAPGAAGMQAGLAAADAWFAEQELKVAGAKRETAVQMRENQLNRNHATYLAKLTDKRTREIAVMEEAGRYDRARLEADASKEKAKLAALADLRGVPMTLGAKMVGSDLGENIQVHKEDFTKMSGTFEVANRRYDALRRVDEAIKDGSFAARMFSGDPELRSAARYLGYTTGKELDPQGRLSDQDVKFATAIDLGYDPSGNIFDQGRFNQNSAKIGKMIEAEMRSMPEKVSKAGSMYLDSNLVGKQAKILWSPQALFQDAPETQNATQVLQGAGLMRTPDAPLDSADFERRQALEKGLGKGSQLPRFDEARVNEFAAGLQGLSPDYIRKMADKTLKDLGPTSTNRDPWGGKVDPGALTTRAAIESVRDKALKDSESRMKAAKTAADTFGFVTAIQGHPKPSLEEISTMVLQDTGLSTPDAVEAAVKAAEAAYERGKRATFRK